MTEEGNATSFRLSNENREKKIAQIRQTSKPSISEVNYSLPDFEAIIERVAQLLKTTVFSEAIQTLKADPELAEWARHGLRLHRDRKSERCLFCEQPLPKNRLDALEAHFSSHYEQFIQHLDEEIKQIQTFEEATNNVRLPHKTELYDDLGAEFEDAQSELQKTLQVTCSFLNKAKQELEHKKSRLFEQITSTLVLPQLDSKAVEKLNAVIQKHNQACDQFQNRINEARELLAKDMIAESLDDFIHLRDAATKANNNVQEATRKVEELNNKIADLEREIVEHRRPAEELNEDLCKYLGHSELRLETENTGYTLIRGGVPAQALSEGEMTAIALLYFLKTLQDKDFDLKNGIIVLDDPVSSLDANALYLAFGFIRERTRDAGQPTTSTILYAGLQP